MTNNQNRLLLASQQQQQHKQQRQNQSITTTSNDKSPNTSVLANDDEEDPSSMVSVDDDFDAYWREEARNPHRNRIRIGRQYQATVPALLKKGDKDARKLSELETMSFCPKKSSRVSDAELDHYFTIAKSLNIFANLVETRSLLGRDVTIADLNHIRHKEGLSLASVIQPTRQLANHGQVSTPNSTTSSTLAPNQFPSTPTSPTTPTKSSTELTSSGSKTQAQLIDSEQQTPQQSSEQQFVSEQDKVTLNQPLLRALSHFISLHHPCHHDPECKKLTKEAPLDDNSLAPVLRHGSFSGKETKARISRSAAKQQQQLAESRGDDHNSSDNQSSDANSHAQPYDDWTREEVELFSKAIEVCGKNFGSIKKDFLPSKSVKSIVEYYYIGFRDSSETGKKKTSQSEEANDGCSSPDKCLANNNGSGNGGAGAGNNASKNKGDANSSIATSSAPVPSTTTPATTTAHGPATTTTSNTKTGTSTSRNNSNTFRCENDDIEKKLIGATSSSFGMIASNDTNNQNKRSIDHKDTSIINSSKSSSNHQSSMMMKHENIDPNLSSSNPMYTSSSNNNIEKRMSVYNFDDDNNKDEPAGEMLECSRPGPEVRPLKAKPVLPSASSDFEADSDAGSLKFFMDGKMVLKLNACQDQQQGMDKCHWVQSNDKTTSGSNRQKRYLKRGNPGDKAPSNGSSQNGSTMEGSPSSQTTQEDLGRLNKNDHYKFIKNMNIDEDSKESMNSSSTVSQHQDQLQQNTSSNNNNINNNLNNMNNNNNSNINTNSYNSNMNNNSNSNINININNNNNNSNSNSNRSQKRQKVKKPPPQTTQIATSTSSSPNIASDLYNGLAGNSQGGLINPSYAFQRDPNMMTQANNPMLSQAMPWLQANHIAMAAAILGGLPGFPGGPVMQHNMPNLNSTLQPGPGGPMNMNHQNMGINPATMNNNNNSNNKTPALPVTSKPMDLSLEHNVSPKSPQKTTPSNRSRSRQVPRNV